VEQPSAFGVLGLPGIAVFTPPENGDDEATVQKNQQTFREIYGKFPLELEPEWLSNLASGKR
jgi:hypothetical protein